MKNTWLRFGSWTLALCILCTSCFSLAENVEDSLVVGILSTRTTQISPLDPLERDIVSLYNVVYESMVTIDDNGIPQPLLAENWTETNNGKTWTFTLRENVKFSDGTPLLAADVVASCQNILDRANNPELSNKGFYQNMRYLVSSIKAKDDRTVEVKAKRSYYGLLYSMTFPVVPAAQVEMENPVGTGPYQFTYFQPGAEIRLEVNPNWWQTEPQVKTIIAKLFLNSKDVITAYETNQVDTVFTRSVAAAQYKSGINSLSISYSTRQLETLLLDHKSFPLESLKIRQAILYAINVPLISQNAYMGMTVNANTPIPSDSWLYYDQESAFVYNPERAMALLAEEGWEDIDNDGILDKVVGDGTKHLVLKLHVYEDPENDVRYETANRIVEMLAAVKIRVNIVAMTYQDQLQKLEAGRFDLALCAFQMDVVPDVGFFLYKGNQQNYGRYISSEMSSLIDTLRTNQNRDDFASTTQAIQQRFAEDVPFICLFYRSGAILTRKMFSTVRTIREFELLRGIEAFGR